MPDGKVAQNAQLYGGVTQQAAGTGGLVPLDTASHNIEQFITKMTTELPRWTVIGRSLAMPYAASHEYREYVDDVTGEIT